MLLLQLLPLRGPLLLVRYRMPPLIALLLLCYPVVCLHDTVDSSFESFTPQRRSRANHDDPGSGPEDDAHSARSSRSRTSQRSSTLQTPQQARSARVAPTPDDERKYDTGRGSNRKRAAATPVTQNKRRKATAPTFTPTSSRSRRSSAAAATDMQDDAASIPESYDHDFDGGFDGQQDDEPYQHDGDSSIHDDAAQEDEQPKQKQKAAKAPAKKKNNSAANGKARRRQTVQDRTLAVIAGARRVHSFAHTCCYGRPDYSFVVCVHR